MPKWTDEQQSAIDLTNSNILVNAAAGSGKTAVLVERIIKKITNPENNIDVDSLLVVTFTSAAAAEMRERISMALTKALHENPQSTILKRQLLLLNYADITTIDSFCFNVVRNNFHLLGLDPSFSIADDSEIEFMKSDVIDELFEELYVSEDKDFLELVKIYSKNRNDSNLKKIILDIYEYVSTLPNEKKWFKMACDEYLLKNGLSESIFAKTIMDKIEIMLDDCIDKNTELYKFITEGEEIQSEYVKKFGAPYSGDIENILTLQEPLYKKYPEIIAEDKIIVETLKQACKQGWNVLYEQLKEVKFKNAPRSNTLETEYNGYISETRQYIRDIVNGLPKMMYDRAENIEKVIIEQLHPVVVKLVALIEKFSNKFMEYKNKKNLYSFSDIEHFCLELILDENGNLTELAENLRDKYTEILLDEYQDSNELQEAIFTSISTGKNMFMVGDMKQSIYRFRNSDPTLFKSKSDTYSTKSGSDNLKVILSKNFRSRQIILDCTNEVFENIMSEYVGEITYDDEQKLNMGADCYPPNTDTKSEFYIIDTSAVETEVIEESVDDNLEEYESPKAIELEARFIARRIKELKNENFMVCNKDGTTRKVENRDIAILMRSPKTSGPIIADELKRNGIEAFVETTGYFEKIEVMFMISLLKVIQNPTQDIPLIAVMRSVIGNFNDNELVSIRMCSYGCMYDALTKACVSDLPEELIKKCTDFVENIKRWRGYAKYMSSDKLIWTLYNETDYYAYVGALAGGEEGQANLRLLFERAKTYEGAGFKGLFNFIGLMERMVKNETNLNPANLITENHNVVRIMTMHKSKGLEFPVTFISASQKKFYKTKPEGNVVKHKDLGLGMEYINPDLKYKYSTITKNAITIRSEIENISEEMRILYVAMTRAREKLIVTGTTANIEKLEQFIESAQLPMSKATVLSAKNYMNWIAPIAKKSDNWKYEIIPSFELLKEEVDNQLEETKALVHSDIDIEKVFGYVYPFEKSPGLPSKVSVSELKRRQYEEEGVFDLNKSNEIDIPRFMNEDNSKFTNAKIGTLIHFVMQNIHLQKDITEEYILSEIGRMIEQEIINVEEASVIDIRKIQKFFNSELGKRMLNADRCYREIPFEIEISANEYDKTLDNSYKDEKIVLQGVIDGYFIENNNIILFDYKTDRYNNISEIIDKYSMQIEYYKTALEKTLNMPVSEKYIYLFYNNYTLEL